MAEERTVEVDPPRRVQVLTLAGEWRDAWLIAWHHDSRRGWLARVVEVRPAAEVRPPREGAAAHRPDGHHGDLRKGRQRPPYRV